MLKVFYGLPKKVIFCKKSLISNQVPNSVPEIYHSKKSKKRTPMQYFCIEAVRAEPVGLLLTFSYDQ